MCQTCQPRIARGVPRKGKATSYQTYPTNQLEKLPLLRGEFYGRSKEDHVYAVVRTYSGAGAKDFFDLLEKRKSEVEAVMRSVPGLVSY